MNSSTCIRCGKERVIAKSWKERIGTSLVTYSSFVCPDSQCQKVVDEELKKKKDHIDAIQARSQKRKTENKRNRKLVSKKSKK